MHRLQKPSFGQVTFVLHFKRPQQQIRFAQGDAEVAFGSFGAGQSQQTNVLDDADPTAARIVFIKDRKNISISQIAVQFVQIFEPGKKGDISTQFQEIRQQLEAFYDQAMEFKPRADYSHAAVIVHINYPSLASLSELHKYVYDKFVAFEPIGELASVQVALGFKLNDLFLNVNASVYEQRQFDFTSLQRKNVTPIPVMLSMNDAKLIGKGVQIVIDVNDRPKYSTVLDVDVASPDNILETMSKFIAEQLPKIVEVN